MNTTNTKRLCRKCQQKIPNRIKIDGVTKNLRSRKFCLTCSPFKQHNTHPSDPGNKGRRDKQKRNRQQVLSLYKRGLERKKLLVEKAGGKCCKCGYCKCDRALSFHHRDRATKLFGLSLNELWSRSMEIIELEAAKCDLVCLNCHMEIENTDSKIIMDVNCKYQTAF